MAGPGQVQPGASGLEREDQEGHIRFSLKFLHDLRPPGHPGSAVENVARHTKHVREEVRQRSGHLLELRKYQHPLPLVPNGPAQLPQHGQFAAVLLVETLLAQILVGVVANLFQLHNSTQHQTLPADALRLLQAALHIRHGLAVQHCLLFRQGHMLHHLQLFRQVGDDPPVGLHPPEQEGGRHGPQAGVALGPLVQRSAEGLELLGSPQQALVQKVEQGPEVGQVVFHRRARHGHTHPGGQLFDLPRLFGQGVLDGLGLVQDHAVPVYFLQSLYPGRHAVGGDREEGRLFRQGLLQRGGGLAMENQGIHFRREAGAFALPVAQQGRGNNQQRPGLGPIRAQPLQIAQHLDGLPQAHVIRQTGAEAQGIHIAQPSETRLLIRPQGGAKARRQRGGGDGLRGAQAGEQPS